MMLPAQKPLELARASIEAARQTKGSRREVIKHYRRAKKALYEVDDKTADTATLAGKLDALRELAVVLDHSEQQKRATKCRQRADTLRQKLDEKEKIRKDAISPFLLEVSIAAATSTSSLSQSNISLSAATSFRQSPLFFNKDMNPAPAQCALPGPDEPLQSTYQLAYSLELLQESVLEDVLSPDALKWRQSTWKNLDEKDRLQTISVQIVEAFKRDALKDAATVTEVVLLASVLDREYSRILFTTFIDTINDSAILNLHSLEGLAKVIQGAAPGSIDSDDHVRVLDSLQRKLQSTHPESIRNRQNLLLAVSQVLDAMVDADTGNVDRINIHGPLTDLLWESESTENPYLVFQAAYATQALLNVSDDDNIWRAGFRRGWLTLKAGAGFAKIPDITEIKDALDGLECLYEIGKRGTRLLKDALEAIKNHEKPSFTTKDGLKFKKAWYRAVRAAESYIQEGKLVQFMDLVTTAPCRHQLMFQWGICQLLGQFVFDSRWDLEIRQEAISLLGAFHRGIGLWSHQKKIDQVIFDVLTNVTTSNSTGFEGAKSLLEEMKSQDPTLKPTAHLKSPLWSSVHPVDTTGHVTAKATLLKTVQIQYPWQPRLYGIHKALKTYHAPDLFIRRVSGEELDLATCFVNLAIVEAPAHRQKEKQDLKTKATLFHRIPSFEKVENTNTESIIPLEQLFNKHTLDDGRKIDPKRILVQGRAGIGKTTLCKKLVHAHQNGWWRDLFDVVLWIPLRQLRGFKGNTLETLFREKVFITQNHDQRQVALAEALATCAGEGRVLFILDGMDEIVADTEGDERRTFKSFLMSLLTQQYVVITSRPSGLDSKLLPPIDLEVETVGFSQHNIKDFLVRVLEPNAVRTVEDFIQRTPLIQGLVNIPVQLDVICFSWDKLPTDGLAITMTGLYQLMVRKLWCKDAVRLKKTAGGMSLTEQEINDMSPEDVDELMATELQHLGCLAFKGMRNNHQIEFEEKDLLSAFRDLKDHTRASQRLLPPQLVKVMKQTSFLHTADVHLDSTNVHPRQAWHFLHLTFQEYFAATWIARHFHHKQQCPSTSMMTKEQLAYFVHQHKYNPQYELVWWMVAGLLEGDPLIDFFALLQAAPRDLIGGRHQRILASCLNEARTRLDSKAAEDLDTELKRWFRFEMQMRRHGSYIVCSLGKQVLVPEVSSLGRQLSFPEDVLIEPLNSENSWKTTLLCTLRARPILSDSAIRFILPALKDGDKDVRYCAASVFAKQSTLPVVAIEPLIVTLKDEHERVRHSAASALGNLSTLQGSVIQPLVAALNNEPIEIQLSAARSLEKLSTLSGSGVQPIISALRNDRKNIERLLRLLCFGERCGGSRNPSLLVTALEDEIHINKSPAISIMASRSLLTESAMQTVISALEDGDRKVRTSTVLSLCKKSTLPELPEPVIQALIAILEDDDQDVRLTASLALAKHCVSLPELAIQPLISGLRSDDASVRAPVARVLTYQSALSASIIQFLIAALGDEDSDVRISAVITLGNQSPRPESLVQPLIGALGDEDENVRLAVLVALGSQSPMPETVLQLLIAALSDACYRVRCEAVLALGKQSPLPEPAIQPLIAALNDEYDDVQWEIISALGGQSTLSDSVILPLIAALDDGDDIVRKSVARIFAKQRTLPDSAIRALFTALKDEDEVVRFQAAVALGKRLGYPEPVMETLVALVKGSNLAGSAAYELRNTLMLPESAIQALIASLKDGSVGSTAATILSKQSALTESAIQSLIALLEDENEVSRSYVSTVLGDQSHSLCTALPRLTKEEIACVYEYHLFHYSCTRIFSLQVQEGRLAICTEKGVQYLETMGNELEERITSAIRAVQEKAGLKV
ncbi:hypothetical protein EMPS_09877 [Entomortierella parvispora]|uniref:NACHT domain-containing protein n=1 Tax=Entomortierella parvispora TaxID=205924 RepID=A0A9P3HJ74_9FUNG|nr:hypothetical protein EMPS_09877 [Entomortierella parvispora]